MNKNIKAAVFTSVAAISTMLFSASVNAQVAGVATTDPTRVVISSKAFTAAYQQIDTTYAAARGQMVAKGKEVNDLLKQLDTNKDNNLDQAELDAAEKAKNPLLAQIDVKKQELAQLQQPLVLAQVFAIEEILKRYNEAQQQVIAAKKINMIIAPDSLLWAPPAIDVTAAIVAALDVLAPSVSTTPTANWQPSRDAYAIQQQFEQARQAAARQPQAGVPAAPGAKPAAPGAKPAAKPTPDSR